MCVHIYCEMGRKRAKRGLEKKKFFVIENVEDTMLSVLALHNKLIVVTIIILPLFYKKKKDTNFSVYIYILLSLLSNGCSFSHISSIVVKRKPKSSKYTLTDTGFLFSFPSYSLLSLPPSPFSSFFFA